MSNVRYKFLPDLILPLLMHSLLEFEFEHFKLLIEQWIICHI
jgi:hypothetical protein